MYEFQVTSRAFTIENSRTIPLAEVCGFRYYCVHFCELRVGEAQGDEKILSDIVSVEMFYLSVSGLVFHLWGLQKIALDIVLRNLFSHFYNCLIIIFFC